MLENIDKYLKATSYHLGVEDERYGGGFRAIIAHRCWVDFLLGMLEGDDIGGNQAQHFFAENPLFPAAYGETPTKALENLDKKIGVLYRFERKKGSYEWKALPQFSLKAEHDCDPNEEQTFYDVDWNEIVSDLRSSSPYFYETSKKEANSRNKRDLFALINFEYQGEFKGLHKL